MCVSSYVVPQVLRSPSRTRTIERRMQIAHMGFPKWCCLPTSETQILFIRALDHQRWFPINSFYFVLGNVDYFFLLQHLLKRWPRHIRSWKFLSLQPIATIRCPMMTLLVFPLSVSLTWLPWACATFNWEMVFTCLRWMLYSNLFYNWYT